MPLEETALELIGLTYDAALAPEKWPTLMARLATGLSARSAMLREVDYAGGNVGLFATVGYDPAYVAAYREHFVRLDYFAPHFVSAPIGTVKTGDQAVPWEHQRNTEFCNDYLLARNIRHVMGGTLARYDRHHLQFGLQRESGQCDFDNDDLQLVNLVTSHMARAVQLQRQAAEVTRQKHWAWTAMDRLRIGVILLDERGWPLHLNRAAERLIAGPYGLSARRDGLRLACANETTQLRRLIAAAANLANGRGSANDAGGCLLANASAGSGAPTVQLQVIPLPRDLSDRPWEHAGHAGCVAVFVSTSGGARLPWNRVAAMHGLTRAEARLASLLADGITLEEAAETLSISIQTVRSQLKSVFAKTGVTRQAELVALLLGDMLSHGADEPAP